MSMHRALLVSEILLEIFVHVNETLDLSSKSARTGKPLSRKSLAALARTCKKFHEPAMDLLWAALNGIEPLLGCVPRIHAIIYRTGERYNWYSSRIERLSEHEVHQFLRHATRVRSLHISFEDDAFYLLPVLPIETCIFPRLQSLTTVLDPARNLHLFLSPTLRRCAIPDIHPDLKSIATRCATLEDLSIKSLSSFHSTTDELSSFHSTADELSLLSDSIHLYKRLVTLSCPPLDWAAWEHLFSLPTLLTVAIEGRDLRPLDRDNFIVTLSLNITVLSFRVETAAYVTAVMQNSEFPSLKEFKIGVDGLLQVDAEQLFRALLQCKACQTLEHISIWSYQNVVREPPSSSFAAITQLVYFTQLRTLRLAFPHCCINLDNDLLFAAMSSWPHIRSLELSDSPHRTVTITFRGLFAALRQCPHLHTLELSIDAVNIDIDPTLESFQHTSLQKFCVGCAQVVDTEAVARIVSSMLPCVDTDGFSYFCVSGLRHKWSTIYSHLTRLKSSAVRNRNITEAAAET